jgi:hypothetical protein
VEKSKKDQRTRKRVPQRRKVKKDQRRKTEKEEDGSKRNNT